jgi:O-antigen chain-terminating methyltransferase
MDAEVAAREGVQHALGAEAGAREALALEVSENSRGRQQLDAKYRETDIALHRLRADFSSQGTRVSTLLAEARKRLPKDFDTAQLAKLSDEDTYNLDSLYLALEDRFRGSREEIKDRMRYYLPMLQNQRIGTRRMPLLDLGCGRGEWLELLCESGLEARGVDANRIFVAACKERGLNVKGEDAVEHLRALPDASVGAVTGFHIIEHLPLGTLINLVDETVRVLKPGGMAIFETPNPQNVLVGCHNFYIDPTHRHPIPCLLAQFILEARGLCNVEIVQLHPYPESFRVRDGGVELAQRFNDYFYGPQDYAVIGRRV